MPSRGEVFSPREIRRPRNHKRRGQLPQAKFVATRRKRSRRRSQIRMRHTSIGYRAANVEFRIRPRSRSHLPKCFQVTAPVAELDIRAQIILRRIPSISPTKEVRQTQTNHLRCTTNGVSDGASGALFPLLARRLLRPAVPRSSVRGGGSFEGPGIENVIPGLQQKGRLTMRDQEH